MNDVRIDVLGATIGTWSEIDRIRPLGEVFSCQNFLDCEILDNPIIVSETDKKGMLSHKNLIFPTRLRNWIAEQVSRQTFPTSPKISDVLKMSVNDFLAVPHLGATTVNDLIRFLARLERHLKDFEKLDVTEKGIMVTPSSGSNKNLFDLYELGPLRHTELGEVWVANDKVLIGVHEFVIFPKIPTRIFNLIKDGVRCAATLGTNIEVFSDFAFITPRQLSKVKGISAGSVEEFMTHLNWLENVLKATSVEVTIYDAALGVIKNMSEVEKLVLKNRNPFLTVKPFREIKGILENELNITLSHEMCRKKFSSVEQKLSDALNGSRYFKIMELFLKLNDYIIPERTIEECGQFVDGVLLESEARKGTGRAWGTNEVFILLGLYSIYKKDLNFDKHSVSIVGSGQSDYIDQIFTDSNLRLLVDVEEFCKGNTLIFSTIVERFDSEVARVVGKYLVKSKPMTNLFEAAIRSAEHALTIPGAIDTYRLNVNSRSLKNAVAEDDRFVRISKDEFTLAETGVSGYEGISHEMEKSLRISGKTLLSVLQRKLLDEKNVNPTSVQFFSAAPIFLLENGFISLRKENQPLRIHPASVDGESVIMDDGRVEVQFLCNRELLRGSGLSIAPGTAALLGVQPSDSAIFLNGELSITILWGPYQMKPRVSTLRLLATALGAQRSNIIRIRFDLVDSSFTAFI